jgi:hypothetical protein
MALLAELARPWLCSGAAPRRRRERDLALVTLAAVLVSFVNPNGADAVRFPLEQLGMIGLAGTRSDLGATIAELRPILGVPGGVGSLVASGGLALVAMALNWRRLALFDGLLYAAFFCLTLSANRNVALLAIASVPIAVRNLNEFIDRHSFPVWAGRAGGALTIVLLVFALVSEVRSQGFIWSTAPLQEDRFPEAAVDWIARQRPDGPIFHAMGDGGYLIWRLHPDYPVMVDGRLEVFGEELYAQLRVKETGRPEGFRRIDEQYRFGVALLHHRFFPALHLLRWMYRSPEWRLVQLDEVAGVFVRVGTVPPVWPEVGADGLGILPPLEDAARSDRDLRRRAARFLILAALDRRDQAAALAEATCARYAGRGTAPFRCGARALAPQRGGGLDSAE